MFASIVGPFAEGVRATFQPCTFLLIVPTSAAVIAAGARWQPLVGATIAAVAGGWLLADNRILLDGAWLRLSALVAIGLLVVLVSRTGRSTVPVVGRRLDHAWAPGVVVAVLTLLATMWWRPCVGEELGLILNGAQDGLTVQLVPMAAYMLGALVPVAVVVAARYTIEPPGRLALPVSWVFAVIGIVVAGSLAAGRHDEVVVALTRWTLE